MENLLTFFERGGILMYPLVVLSVLAFAIMVEKLLGLRPGVVAPPSLRSLLKPYLLNRDYDALIAECVQVNAPLGRLTATLVKERDLNREDLKDVLFEKGREEILPLKKHLNILGSIATVSPLLGLLGTVLGMIRVFSVISVEGLSQEGLSGGISEALLTTATGLGIAIPALVAYQLLSARVQTLAALLEQEGLMVIRLLKPYRRGEALQQESSTPKE